MWQLKTIIVLFGLFFCSTVAQNSTLKWWQTASFYQIYPRSLKDSDGDGVGDLKGVTQKLAYFKEIGITATWLSPIFTSPMADFGYDITNFTEIDPIFGTMQDFEDLVDKAKTLGIKIILDFVPNHTSDECEWFIKSAANDPEYRDFYVWHPGKIVNGVRQPPTNWISVFRGSMWTWHEGRQAYYLHQFLAKQPDLNIRNPKVVEALNDVLRFWLRKGVSGFRVDAVTFLYEIAPDSSGNYPDEPRNPNVDDPEDRDYNLHTYTQNQPESTEIVFKFRQAMDEINQELGGDERILMTEVYGELDDIIRLYGNETHDGAQVPFNFELLTKVGKQSNALYYSELINSWLTKMPAGRTANWVFGNHDQPRVGSRLGEDMIDIINMILLTLPGCSVTYQGEELGMTDVSISWNDTVDPQACRTNPQIYESLSRDPVRTPFQWNDNKFAGFTEGNSTWLPLSENYKMVNIKRARGISHSHFNVYKNLQKLRRETVLQHGDAEVKDLSENVLAIKRSLPGSISYVILVNISNNVESLNIQTAFNGISSQLQYVLVTDRSLRRKGDLVNSNSLVLMPKEGIVLKTV